MKKRNMLLWWVFFAIFIGVNVLVAGLDANKNNAGDWGPVLGNHIISFIARCAVGFFCVMFSYPDRVRGGFRFDVPYPEGLWDFLLIYPAAAAIAFDLTYNGIREGLSLLHVGSTSFPDIVFYWIGQPWSGIVFLFVKVGVLALGIFLKITEKLLDDADLYDNRR